MGKKDKLPRGVGRLPEWWLEITPHETLYLEEDEAERQTDHEEAMKFAQLAAEQDLLQKYGGEGFPNWNPASDGPRTQEEEKEWVSKGYKRNETNEWVDDQGAPLEGRQFKGQMPPGYLPGKYNKGGSGGSANFGPGTLNATKYETDKNKNWEQPSWMKLKLRSTGAGSAIRKGEYESGEKAIVKGTDWKKEDGAKPEPGKRVKRVSKRVIVRPKEDGEEGEEEEYIEEIIDDGDEEIIEEIVYEDEDGNEIVQGGLDESVHEVTELQKILQKRLHASG